MATELATAYISLVPTARGMKSTITSEISGAGVDGSAAIDRHMSGAGGRSIGGSLKSTLTGAFRGAAIAGSGLLAGAVAGGALASEFLGTGAELDAWKRKTDTVFEGQAGNVRAWADANAEAFGVTDDNLAGLAANFGDLLKPMGFSADEAAAMSQEVVGLSGALSAWSGGTRSAAEVSEILSSAMLGEREALKGLGISISEADVQAKLAAKGQDGLTGAALEQAKAVATQELIFEKSTDAQKAFAEGGNEALTATNKLKSQFGELKEEAATRLVPMLTNVASWLGDNLPRYAKAAQEAFQRVGAWWRDEGPGIMTKAREIFGVVRDVVSTVVAFVRENWPEIKRTIESAMESVRSVISSVVSIVQTLWRNFGDNIMSTVRRVFPGVLGIIRSAWTIISGIFETFSALLKGDWSAVWDGIKNILSGAMDFVNSAFEIGMGLLQGAASTAWEVLRSIISGAWDKIKELAAWALQWLVDEIAKTPDRIGTAASGMWDGIKDAFKAAINWIIRTWNDLSFTLPSAEVFGQKVGGWTLDTPNLPEFHQGGRIPGPAGSEVPIMGLAGERVLSPAETRAYENGGGGLVIQGNLIVSDKRVTADLDMWARSRARDLGVI